MKINDVALFKSWAIYTEEETRHRFLARGTQVALYSTRDDARITLRVHKGVGSFPKAKVVRVQVAVTIVGE